MAMRKFLPIILGSDENAYGCARMFYEINAERPLLLCSKGLLSSSHSGILNRRIIKNFDDDRIFSAVFPEIISALKNEAEKLLVIPCSDYYTELLVKHSYLYRENIDSPLLSYDVYKKFCNKADFCELCREYEIPHPPTAAGLPSMFLGRRLYFEYPIVLKPANSNSSEYLHSTIEKRKKAYICKNEGELKEALESFVTDGYNRTVVIQNYIRGGEKNSRVVNAYCDRNARVRLIGAGRPLLEYRNALEIGNYAAIKTVKDRALCDKAADFLESIGYVGFANFDIKYDEESGEYMFLELNPRQGRSSYYIHTAGENLMAALYEDAVLGKSYGGRKYAEREGVWVNEPVSVIKREMESQGSEETAVLDEYRTDCALSFTYDFSIPRAFSLMHRKISSYTKEI